MAFIWQHDARRNQRPPTCCMPPGPLRTDHCCRLAISEVSWGLRHSLRYTYTTRVEEKGKGLWCEGRGESSRCSAPGNTSADAKRNTALPWWSYCP